MTSGDFVCTYKSPNATAYCRAERLFDPTGARLAIQFSFPSVAEAICVRYCKVCMNRYV